MEVKSPLTNLNGSAIFTRRPSSHNRNPHPLTRCHIRFVHFLLEDVAFCVNYLIHFILIFSGNLLTNQNNCSIITSGTGGSRFPFFS